MQTGGSAEPLSVLVVDDDPSLARTLADVLRLHGYAPSTAVTGKDGLAMAERLRPALAVVDLRLPDMDGMELAARLHALSELTEVVVLTGNATMESAVAALREHSIDYLLKPVNVEHLLMVAARAAERWQRRHAEVKLRESNERFRRVFESDMVGMTFWNEDAIYEANDAFLRMVGYTRDDLEAGHLRTDALTPSEYREIDLLKRQEIGERGVIEPYEKEYFTKEGGRVPVLIGASLLGGEGEGGVAVVLDITDRKRTERALRQAQRLEAVGRVASGVSHDFNNLLTAITGFADLILLGLSPTDPLRGDVDEILKAARRASGLTRQLLAFSRESALQLRLVQLNDVVHDMEKMIRQLAGSDIEVHISLSPNLEYVEADPSQIEQVVMNLCVNARDAMPSGGRLVIQTRNVELGRDPTDDYDMKATGPYVMLSVADNGHGMDAETKTRIFEPYFTTKSPEKGTGLGLATVYGIVTQSGGELAVTSDVGQGTRFKIFFPRRSAPASST